MSTDLVFVGIRHRDNGPRDMSALIKVRRFVELRPRGKDPVRLQLLQTDAPQKAKRNLATYSL